MSRDSLRRENETASARAAALRARILVVEPDDDTRSLYREWFQPCDCDVVEAADGRQALTKALVRRPGLVITEIRLPFIDGYALCEILRRDHVTSDVPILVVTGDARPAELSRAKTAGASAVLVKPATREQMLDETRRLLVDSAEVAEPAAAAGPEGDAPPPTRGCRRMSKSLARVATSRPPLTPPPAVCPLCDRLLTYRHSHLGGVSQRQREQWDWYVCPTSCGMFEYRHRTRRLRRLVADDALR